MNVELETGDLIGSGRKTVNLPDHLDVIASAPDGIQKLRGLILELAVRGKLVPQDPQDEPAGELLKRIAEERARLEAEGSCKKSKATPPVADDEQPYKIPNTWAWTRLPDVYFSISPSGNKLLSSEIREAGNVPVVDQGKRYVAGYTDDASLVIKVPGPVVIFGDHTTERKYIDFDFVAGADGIKILRPILQDEKFFFRQLQAFRLEERGYARHFKVLNGQLYALPPLAEQHRIIAKVDELMALCDRLAAEQADAESAHARLVETLLGTLTQSADAADLATNWHRLAEHFDTLFTTESSLDALKQTILQLAVMGKLVPQDPSDEEATKLLKRIRGSRQYKRKFSAVDVDSLESPLPEIPNNWIWTVIDQVADDNDNSITDGPFGANLKTEHYIPTPGHRVIRLQNIGSNIFRAEHHAYVDLERFDRLQKHHVVAGDLIVAGLVDERLRCCKLPADIGKALVKADCYRFAVHKSLNTEYALYYLNSPTTSAFASAHHHGMTLTRIGLGNFRQLPFALPPLAEQHRIVAKVDELMALCDRLKADLADARSRQTRLATTLIDTALQAA